MLPGHRHEQHVGPQMPDEIMPQLPPRLDERRPGALWQSSPRRIGRYRAADIRVKSSVRLLGIEAGIHSLKEAFICGEPSAIWGLLEVTTQSVDVRLVVPSCLQTAQLACPWESA